MCYHATGGDRGTGDRRALPAVGFEWAQEEPE